MDKKEDLVDYLKKRVKDTGSACIDMHRDTVQDIVHFLDPPITPPEKMPDGYEWRDKEYRLPKKGEWCISLNNGNAYQAGHDYVDQQHYIIYKKEAIKPPEKIPDGYEWKGEHRLPEKDEWMIDEDGAAYQTTHDWLYIHRHIIYKKEPIKPPEKIPEGYEWRGEYRKSELDEWVIDEMGNPAYMGGAWAGFDRYIIYKIEPKFKPGDVLVTASGAIWLMSSEGVHWLDGDLYDGHPGCVMATTTQINEYLRGNPRQAVKAVQTLAKFYAKEAKQ